jgi:serine/threonine protein kinase
LTILPTDGKASKFAEWENALSPFTLQRSVVQAYELKEKIGEGSYGTVFRGTRVALLPSSSIPTQAALKFFELPNLLKSVKNSEAIMLEMRSLWDVAKCGGTITLKEAFLDTDYLCLVFDFHKEGTLFD